MKLKNIVIINDYANVNGGTASVAISTANNLAEKGYNIKFICATGNIDLLLKNNNIEVISTNQNDLLNKSKIRASVEGIWNQKGYSTVKNVLSELNKEETIVHIHGWTKVLSASVIKAVIDLNFEFCITTHDYFPVCPNGGIYNYKKNEVCNIKPMSVKCMLCNCDKRNYIQKLWRYLRGIVQKKILYIKPIKYISISDNNMNLIKRQFRSSKFYFLENPTQVKKDKRIKVEKNKYYGAIGRISNEKGMDILAKATKENKYEVIIIGGGPQEDFLLDINKDIEITGWLNKDEVIDKMKQLRACILPSRWYEGMPLVVGEAMSMGIPVVTSDICNAQEKIINNTNGIVFKNESVEELIKSIEKLEDNSNLKKISENAYKSFWEKDRSINNHCDKLIEIYYDIMNDKEVINGRK